MKTFIRFLSATSGATAVEYGLLASIISIALLAGFGNLSNQLVVVFNKITTTLNGAP